MDSLQSRANDVLGKLVESGFEIAFICTEGGLLVAGEGGHLEDHLASLVSLMDLVLQRAHRDLAMSGIDEVTIHDAGRRIVIRPVVYGQAARMFLVLSVPPDMSWRRLTNNAIRSLGGLLGDIAGAADDSV